MQKVNSAKKNLARDALLMELFYSGDKIKIAVLARQFKMDKAHVRLILKKYFPAQTDRDVVMLISSKINKLWGSEDKQEGPED